MAYFKHNIKLYLQQKAEKNKPTPIRCFVLYDNQQAVIPSGEVIEPRNWDDTVKEPKRKAGFTDGPKIAKNLKFVKDCISTSFDHLTALHQRYPDPGQLKSLVLQVMKNEGVLPGNGKKTTDLFVYIDQLISDTASGKRVKGKGELYSPGTIRHYNSAYGVLKRFAAHNGKSSYQFNEITLSFYFELKDYAYQVEKLSDNYFGTVVKFLKTCMNESKEEQLHNNNQYANKRFVKVAVDVENVYLTNDQLETLLKHDFSEDTRLERARDMFLVGCWTGLRFSDFVNIKANNIKGDFIEIKTQKTGETVAIPIHPAVREIMARYENKTSNSLPPPISNVKLNEYIKEVAKASKFTELVSLDKSKAGVNYAIQKPLHELISTHTARRAFASNMFKMGIPSIVIMGVTGHKTEKAFLKYIKVTPKEKAELMMAAWSRQSMKVVNADAI